MTVEDMVPDTVNPQHDAQFWCLPRMHSTASERQSSQGFAFYLITEGRKVGIFNNWTLAQAMVTNFPSGGYRGHQTVEGCTLR
ncbi:hypothetical protein B0H17DRAFT_1206871 [Mycena rosella]|uniref:Ribonuclease H1 N-terminal domain-containing protein n=1 Tax=Mycena rosella TaxID=1033263 RepID=A0AAD7D4T6_MYCRO|nr:hypothetical protein B0H17DRAFT_1206871 [Mycena rosella]